MTGIPHLTLLSMYLLNAWSCYENELLIWLLETGRRHQLCDSGIRKNEAEKITALSTVLLMLEVLLANTLKKL